MHTQQEHLELYESHLKACPACGVQFGEPRANMGEWVGLAGRSAYSGPEKRRHPRLETDDPAILTVLKPEPSRRIKIRILDASKYGLQLQVPHRLMAGAVVQLHLRDLFILAEVRHCRQAGALFHAGVLILDVFPFAG